MAQSRCVSIIGDSNIKRHMSTNNCRDRPLMSGAQIVSVVVLLFLLRLSSQSVPSPTCA